MALPADLPQCDARPGVRRVLRPLPDQALQALQPPPTCANSSGEIRKCWTSAKKGRQSHCGRGCAARRRRERRGGAIHLGGLKNGLRGTGAPCLRAPFRFGRTARCVGAPRVPPARLLGEIRLTPEESGMLMVSLPNVANITVRLALLFGRFHYTHLFILPLYYVHLLQKKNRACLPLKKTVGTPRSQRPPSCPWNWCWAWTQPIR